MPEAATTELGQWSLQIWTAVLSCEEEKRTI
uniref:Uncharacterized protein n=1 Tax=Arundo donax TaxID=35708 RepID=A0A0A9ABS0_ARUDO